MAKHAHTTPAPTVRIPNPDPNAELAAIGGEALPLVLQYQASAAAFFAIEHDGPELMRAAHLGDAPAERLDVLSARATALRATTQAGYAAKALLLWHAFRMHYSDRGEFNNETPELVLAWSLIGDLLPEGVTALPLVALPTSGPDADLIRLCSEAEALHREACDATEKIGPLNFSSAAYAREDRRFIKADAARAAKVRKLCAYVPKTFAGHTAMARLALTIADAFGSTDPDSGVDALEYVPAPLVEQILANLAGHGFPAAVKEAASTI